VVGRENIPRRGPCLFIFNQVSNFDTPLLSTLFRRTDATGLVAADYRARLFERLMVEAGGGTWIRRGASDRQALQTALDCLASGWIVGISPEGRRSPTGALIRAQPGAAFLAARAQVPILPIAITNTKQLAAALKRGRRIAIGIRIGEPFDLPPLTGLAQKQRLQSHSAMMMARLAALLPPEYRGVYAEHPSA
jgi:1-acyl-sn-glycerol-3-phosphate acyltransferase